MFVGTTFGRKYRGNQQYIIFLCLKGEIALRVACRPDSMYAYQRR